MTGFTDGSKTLTHFTVWRVAENWFFDAYKMHYELYFFYACEV